MSAQTALDEDGIARALIGHRYHDDDDGVYVGRGEDGRNLRDAWGKGHGGWGNPFVIEEFATEDHHDRDSITIVSSREESIERYETLVADKALHDDSFRRRLVKLAGEKLDCWCQSRGEVGDACHATVLAKWALYFKDE